MSNELTDMLDRLCLLEKDIFTGTVFEGQVDALPVGSYTQETTPYFTNDIVSFPLQLQSQAIQVINYQITMTLVLHPYGSGFEQEAEELAIEYVPVVLQYMGTHRQLRRTAADIAVSYLDPRGSLVTGGSIKREPKSGIGQTMMIVYINLEVPMWQSTDQVVF